MSQGNKLVDQLTVDYVSDPIAISDGKVLVKAALAANVRSVEVFDSSGSVMLLSYGAASDEKPALNIIPGGNELRPLLLNAGMPLYLSAVDADATAGKCVINFFY